MGEGYGIYSFGNDEGVLPYVSHANVACGFHASDPSTMRRTVEMLCGRDVGIGAHPSYPDVQGFGRREMALDPDEVLAAVLYQVGALLSFLRERSVELSHIKPHGALYGVAARDREVAEAILEAARIFGVPLLGMSGTMHERVWGGSEPGFVSEYCADLDYAEDGALSSRARTYRATPRTSRRGSCVP